jgi:hypothetical protein
MKRDTIPLSKPIPVKLPPAILDRIDEMAKRLGEPRSTVMRIAMRIGLESLEKVLVGDPPNLSSLISHLGRAGDTDNPKSGERKRKAG